jgi:uncharacterized membrane protein YadS
LLSPSLALAAGLLYGLALAHPYHLESRRLSKLLLQASVVGLGFGMILAEVVKVGRSGFLYTACSHHGAMLLGLAIGRWLGVERTSSFLITVGDGHLSRKRDRSRWIRSQTQRKKRWPLPWAQFFC